MCTWTRKNWTFTETVAVLVLTDDQTRKKGRRRTMSLSRKLMKRK
jgi:hypothetical protein